MCLEEQKKLLKKGENAAVICKFMQIICASTKFSAGKISPKMSIHFSMTVDHFANIKRTIHLFILRSMPFSKSFEYCNYITEIRASIYASAELPVFLQKKDIKAIMINPFPNDKF